MATFAKGSYDSARYAAARPTYPRLLYDVVLQFHKKGPANADSDRWECAVDLGCGTGIMSFNMVGLEIYRTIIVM
jgi:predicted TPR repeat methyltransferase